MKKGLLLAEETLKMILALISLSILAYLLFSIYGSGKEAKDLEFAESSLDRLVREISVGAEEVEIYNPEGWVLMSWPYSEDDEILLSCSNLGWKDCICMVENIGSVKRFWYDQSFTQNLRDAFFEKIDEKGICRENVLDLDVNLFEGGQEPLQIDNPPVTLLIDYDNKLIGVKDGT